jgi:signal transduction histidine kinase
VSANVVSEVRVGGRWWLWLCLAAAAELGLYYVAPVGGNGQSIVYQLAGTGSAFALAVGARRRPRGRRRGWILLSTGFFLFSLGDAIWDFYYGWYRNWASTPSPSSADALYLAGYAFVIVGVVLVIPSRRIRLGDLLDVGVLTSSAAGVMWFFWIAPPAHAAGIGAAARFVSAAYPTMDLLVFVVLVYAAFATRTRPTWMQLLGVSFAFMLTADLVYYGSYSDGAWVDAGWLVSYLLVSGAALHPGGIESRPARQSSARWMRFALVACAALLLPAAMLADAVTGGTLSHGYAPAGFAIAIVILVILRMAMLLQEQSRRERERAKLLRRSVEATEEERRRVARDLHDGPIQAMTAIVLKLDLLGRRLERERMEPLPLLDEIRSDVASEISSLRQVMTDLRPQMLDQQGLAVALANCAQTVLEGSGIGCSVQADLDGARIAHEIESTVYRVAREALINVRKHARATHAGVSLEPTDGGLHLVVRDDGIGFDPRVAGVGDAAKHFGLVAMEEGVSSLGGTLTVRSVAGAGTTVEAELPFAPA